MPHICRIDYDREVSKTKSLGRDSRSHKPGQHTENPLGSGRSSTVAVSFLVNLLWTEEIIFSRPEREKSFNVIQHQPKHRSC